jgi:heat-inducible transcriptional repressor
MLSNNISDLTNREATILSDVVEYYIESGLPVSSGYLTKNCGLNISSATIRNAMFSLEQKGYLTHLHTSSGRIPTDTGYRFYVNIIQEYQVLDNQISEKIEQELLIISNNVDELLDATAFMLAKVSRMFGIILVSEYQKSMLSDIELVVLEGNRVMLVLAMDTGSVESIVMNLNLTIQPKLIHKITRILKERLVGFSLKEIQSTINRRLNDTEMYSHELVQILINNSNKYFHIDNNKSIYTSSTNVLLDQPEFQDISNFQRILPALDKAYLNNHFKINFTDQSNQTLIGKENEDELLKDCAIITTQFDSGLIKGRIGVVGPKRVPYISVQATLKKFAEIIHNAL